MKTTLWMMVLLAGCAPKGSRPTGAGVLDTHSLEAVARNAFGVELAPKPVTELDENLIALRSGPFTVAQRTDSRTYFVRNRGWGALADDGVFNGSEDVLRQRAAKILAALQIDAKELAHERVLHVFQGGGELDEATGQTKAEPWESNQSVLVAGREVDGVPVFTSRLWLGLTASGAIGRLKLHWPEIPPAVLDEARRYQALVRGGFKPPASDDEVASITAGIIHSSPRSRLMDMMAAIRVEYVKAPTGKPRVEYLNAKGERIRARHDEHPAPPRQTKPAQPAGAPT